MDKNIWEADDGIELRCKELGIVLFFTDIIHKSKEGIYEIINDYPQIAELDDKKNEIKGIELGERFREE